MNGKILCMPGCTLVLENFDVGLYIFDNEGSTGKTYLATMLNRCKNVGEPVSSFTYADVLQGRRPLDVCKTTDEVVVLDRYDMYAHRFEDDVLTLAQNTVVLVDAKVTIPLFMRYGMCILHWEGMECCRVFGSR